MERSFFARRNNNMHVLISRMTPAERIFAMESDQPLRSFDCRRAASHRLECLRTTRLKNPFKTQVCFRKDR